MNTILYCQEEVEAQYAEWLESRVGSHEEVPGETEDQTQFSRAAITAHLDRSIAELTTQRDAAAMGIDLREALARAVNLLKDIKEEYESAAHADTRKLEESLSGIDRMLDAGVRKTVDDAGMQAIESEVDAQIKPYKRHMEKAVFAQTRDNLLRKRLREHFQLPRLSLFYL